jgi:hypothetical protein
MAHKVFICHSSKDKQVADAACAALEAQRIPCWIAPRDILPGAEYMEALGEAISGCQIVVLIFSQAANDSGQVRREIERAVSREKIIVPFRIENVMLSQSMEFALSSTHWLDALTPPKERRLAELCETISLLLQKQTAAGKVATRPEPLFRNPPKKKAGLRGFRGWAWGALAVLALVAVFAAVRLHEQQPQSQQAQAPVVHPAPPPAVNPNPADTQAAAPREPAQKPLADSKPAIQIPSQAHEPVRVPAAAQQPTAQKPASVVDSKPAAQYPAKTELQTPVRVADSKPPVQKSNIKDIASQAWDLDRQKRYSEAAPLYDQACTGGDAASCGTLAYMYDQGRGVTRDKSRGAALYARACEGGETVSCIISGMAYRDGNGVAKDGPRAAALFSKACNSVESIGCGDLGLIYEYGDGVEKDLAKARQAYARGCDSGHQDDCDDLKKLK